MLSRGLAAERTGMIAGWESRLEGGLVLFLLF